MNEDTMVRIAAALERIADRLDQVARATVFQGNEVFFRGKPVTELDSGEFEEMWREIKRMGLRTDRRV